MEKGHPGFNAVCRGLFTPLLVLHVSARASNTLRRRNLDRFFFDQNAYRSYFFLLAFAQVCGVWLQWHCSTVLRINSDLHINSLQHWSSFFLKKKLIAWCICSFTSFQELFFHYSAYFFKNMAWIEKRHYGARQSWKSPSLPPSHDEFSYADLTLI